MKRYHTNELIKLADDYFALYTETRNTKFLTMQAVLVELSDMLNENRIYAARIQCEYIANRQFDLAGCPDKRVRAYFERWLDIQTPILKHLYTYAKESC